jgi:protein-S-isoprenylcysteine O-methyltransferase Ste14
MSGLRHLNYPPVWLVAFMGLGWLLAKVHAPMGDALIWPGRILILLGIGVMIWAALAFQRTRTTIVPHQIPTALVDSGPFKFSRNPIYLADVVVLFGWCMSLGSPLAMIALPAPFILVLTRLFIIPEEERLTRHIGEAYTTYSQRVRRWL